MQMFQVRFTGQVPFPAARIVQYRYDVTRLGSEDLHIYFFCCDERIIERLKYQIQEPHETAKEFIIERALHILCLQEIEGRLADPNFSPAFTRNTNGEAEKISITEEMHFQELSEFVQNKFEKKCEYQTNIARDMYCMVLSDSPRKRLINGLPMLPTSPPICYKCDLPDTRILCSGLSHPEFAEKHAHLASRNLGRALCSIDSDGITDSKRCTITEGGHKCAHRIVTISIATESTVRFYPHIIADALDYFDVEWRNCFGKNCRLLQIGTIADIVTISQICSNRADFQSMVSALDDILKRMTIGDDLIPEADRNKEEIKGDKTLNRLKSCLRNKLETTSMMEAERHIGVIKTLNAVRVSMQHSGRAKDLPSALAKFGISVPIGNWSLAWEKVASRVAEAINSLRRLIRDNCTAN